MINTATRSPDRKGATMHSATVLSAGLLFCATAAHGFAPTPAAQRYDDGRSVVLRSSCRSVVPLRIARPTREGSRTNLNKDEDVMGQATSSAVPAEKMFTSFDAFRKRAIKEVSSAEQAFSRFDKFLQSDGEKKN